MTTWREGSSAELRVIFMFYAYSVLRVSNPRSGLSHHLDGGSFWLESLFPESKMMWRQGERSETWRRQFCWHQAEWGGDVDLDRRGLGEKPCRTKLPFIGDGFLNLWEKTYSTFSADFVECHVLCKGTSGILVGTASELYWIDASVWRCWLEANKLFWGVSRLIVTIRWIFWAIKSSYSLYVQNRDIGI